VRFNGFTAGFEKTAFLGPAGAVAGAATKAVTAPLKWGAKAVGKGLKWGAKGAIAAGGGKLNTAMNTLGAVSDYSDASRKMREAAMR
jgi:hypothetical protein